MNPAHENTYNDTDDKPGHDPRLAVRLSFFGAFYYNGCLWNHCPDGRERKYRSS